MSKCGSCGAEIVWAKTAAGRKMPLDNTPHPAGRIDLGADGFATVLGAKRATEVQVEGRKLYQSHFATCPNAAQHRRR